MSEPPRKALRGTFEDVRFNMQKLREWLDRLVDENRPLRKDERPELIETVDRALMGLGRKVEIKGGLILKSSNLPGYTTINNVEELLRLLAYHDAGVSTDDEGVDHNISELWKTAREKVLVASPVVLEAAARMSAERRLSWQDTDEV